MQGRDSAPSANERGGTELQDAVIAGAKPEQALLLEELLREVIAFLQLRQAVPPLLPRRRRAVHAVLLGNIFYRTRV